MKAQLCLDWRFCMCPSAPCLCSSQQSRPYSLISSLPERKSWVQLILPNLESLEANNYCRNILSTCMQWTSLQGSKKSLVREISKYHPMYQHATVRQCCVRQEVPRPGSSPRFSPRFDVYIILHWSLLLPHFGRQVQEQGQSDAALQAKQCSLRTF